jgi:hypothetical protein
VAAAAALATAAAAAGIFTVVGPDREPADVLAPRPERERAVLTEPYLTGSGTLPDAPVHSVAAFPVPFTFADPEEDPDGRPWRYRLADLVDIGDGRGGVVLVAPTETYDPARPWQGQTELEPAPTDAAGWGEWLERTGHVEITERRELLVGGAPAVRFTLDLGELPDGYDRCGGGRTCLAITPMLDPEVGPGRAGTGPQTGIVDDTAELTAIDVDGRTVLVLVEADPDSVDEWLPTARALVDSLRFA